MATVTWVIIKSPDGTFSLDYLFPRNIEMLKEKGLAVQAGTPLVFQDEEPYDIIAAVLPKDHQEVLCAFATIAEMINPGEGRQVLQEFLNEIVAISTQEAQRPPHLPDANPSP
ncbi:MAG: hypothetical protein Q7S63_01200 [bacterium]|nr:hypothetical protein [bacterium]